MKKRKKEKLNKKKEEKKKEWERINKLQEFERTYILLDTHFDLEKYIVESDDGICRVDLEGAISSLSCEGCSHFKIECNGKELRGDDVMNCLLENKHKGCDIGMIYSEDWNYIDDEDYFEEN